MHDVERAIGRIAGRQDNVIAREQLLASGLGRGAIAHRLRVGRLRRVHQRVYLMGPAPPTAMARKRAAAMACGPGAVVSHRSAAELFGLLPDAGGEIDVTVPRRNPGRHDGIRVHRIAAFAPGEVTSMRSVPLTSVARTICDLAATEPA